jgi:hypothetical protein
MRLRGVRAWGAWYMSEEPRPAVTTPVQIDFPWERVVVLMLMVLTFAIAVMAADMLGYLPTPV